MIEKLNTEIHQIVQERKLTSWENSWMWKQVENGRDQLEYYFLVVSGHNGFSYRDLDGVDIEVKIDSSLGKYRIDIKERYKTHNFWLFDDNTAQIVIEYVKDIISHQYESIIERYQILEISNDAYYDREPSFIRSEIRDLKINEILNKKI